ncbi:hypothetical protein BN2475_860009 [Paraburkholderia ribeironis]|uniref:Uncharacterized protein n=1 Tax=Paraburkholderia ribeironis TaxID=1247936 RepID=A0A1N7SKJ8_9BURK|nr:hypothetical protein BN2475_860009 [Paraburkholderia ribeironis]
MMVLVRAADAAREQPLVLLSTAALRLSTCVGNLFFDSHGRVTGIRNGIAQLVRIDIGRLDRHQMPGRVDGELREIVNSLQRFGNRSGAVSTRHVIYFKGNHELSPNGFVDETLELSSFPSLECQETFSKGYQMRMPATHC